MQRKHLKSSLRIKKDFPKFKSRKRIHKESYYFIKDQIGYITHNIIKIPILGRIRITQNYDLPNIEDIISGRVIREYNKYYIILIYEYNNEYLDLNDNSLGVDLGLKNYCTIANSSYNIGTCVVKHFKNNPKYKKISDKIVKLQQIISHKAEVNYYRLLNKWLDNNPTKELSENYKNIMKGESYNSSQIRKLFKKIRVLKSKLNNIRYDFINKTVHMLTAITKPRCITVEDLNVMDMIKHNGTKDTKLHKSIQESSFYSFKIKLLNKCLEYGIKFRMVTQWYPSTKKCFICNHKFKDITLNDRTLYCPNCGLEIDRDINAAYNMLNVKDKYCEIVS
jgi:transposase, IS605 orfB family